MHNVTSFLDRLRCRRRSRDWWAYFGAFGDEREGAVVRSPGGCCRRAQDDTRETVAAGCLVPLTAAAVGHGSDSTLANRALTWSRYHPRRSWFAPSQSRSSQSLTPAARNASIRLRAGAA